MNKDQTKIISQLLNERGFVIDEDIDDLPVSYKKIASWIKSHEAQLREHGYDGGPLCGWSSGFRGFGCSYGVTDSDREVSDEWIDNYCEITESIESSNINVGDIIKYKLCILFECPCGHASNVSPVNFPRLLGTKNLNNIVSRCTKCSSSISPTCVNKPWKKNITNQ